MSASSRMKKRSDPNESWCRKQAASHEAIEFWENWRETQWGLPTFRIMRQWIEARLAEKANNIV